MINCTGGIIWDWNGTLLNDAHLSVQTMNKLLTKRDLPLLSLDSYRDVFTFPVREYYRKIGFDFLLEPFEIPASEFIELYNCEVNRCLLHPDSTKVLNHFQSLGIPQFVLSAMQQETLDDCLIHHQINHYFEHVSGLNDHYAVSKTENGHRLISALNMDSTRMLLIGDTDHDYEVACELGCSCVLVANGHQSRSILESTGAKVINCLSDLLN